MSERNYVPPRAVVNIIESVLEQAFIQFWSPMNSREFILSRQRNRKKKNNMELLLSHSSAIEIVVNDGATCNSEELDAVVLEDTSLTSQKKDLNKGRAFNETNNYDDERIDNDTTEKSIKQNNEESFAFVQKKRSILNECNWEDKEKENEDNDGDDNGDDFGDDNFDIISEDDAIDEVGQDVHSAISDISDLNAISVTEYDELSLTNSICPIPPDETPVMSVNFPFSANAVDEADQHESQHDSSSHKAQQDGMPKYEITPELMKASIYNLLSTLHFSKTSIKTELRKINADKNLMSTVSSEAMLHHMKNQYCMTKLNVIFDEGIIHLKKAEQLSTEAEVTMSEELSLTESSFLPSLIDAARESVVAQPNFEEYDEKMHEACKLMTSKQNFLRSGSIFDAQEKEDELLALSRDCVQLAKKTHEEVTANAVTVKKLRLKEKLSGICDETKAFLADQHGAMAKLKDFADADVEVLREEIALLNDNIERSCDEKKAALTCNAHALDENRAEIEALHRQLISLQEKRKELKSSRKRDQHLLRLMIRSGKKASSSLQGHLVGIDKIATKAQARQSVISEFRNYTEIIADAANKYAETLVEKISEDEITTLINRQMALSTLWIALQDRITDARSNTLLARRELFNLKKMSIKYQRHANTVKLATLTEQMSIYKQQFVKEDAVLQVLSLEAIEVRNKIHTVEAQMNIYGISFISVDFMYDSHRRRLDAEWASYEADVNQQLLSNLMIEGEHSVDSALDASETTEQQLMEAAAHQLKN